MHIRSSNQQQDIHLYLLYLTIQVILVLAIVIHWWRNGSGDENKSRDPEYERKYFQWLQKLVLYQIKYALNVFITAEVVFFLDRVLTLDLTAKHNASHIFNSL